MQSSGDLDILDIPAGSIRAPAGFGKTQLIAETLRRFTGSKPILILTHTNAGVAALRARLEKFKIPSECFRVYTLDSWAIRTLSYFPFRSAFPSSELRSKAISYPAVRAKILKLLTERHIDEVISSTYSRLLVDEYQDCQEIQHDMVKHIASLLPTCVFGDPLQAIFGFGSNTVVPWQKVEADFPALQELTTPWRWRNSGNEELGRWLYKVRVDLMAGRDIDLSAAPHSVSWIQLKGDGEEIRKAQLSACNLRADSESDNVLVIGDSRSPESRNKLASQIPGASVVERVDFSDLLDFGSAFNPNAPYALDVLIRWRLKCLTGLNEDAFRSRVNSLAKNTQRRPGSALELSALSFEQSRTFRDALSFLQTPDDSKEERFFRPELHRAIIRVLQMKVENEDIELLECASRIRESGRAQGRLLSKCAVGSTLLVKGLESEVAVILDADQMDRRNLYVALTRASKKVVICSRSRILSPE